MPLVTANGRDICYEIEGSGEPLLLVMGLGGQLSDWHPGFVERLTEHFTVIRFDNRDVGLSSYENAPTPSRWQFVKAAIRPELAKAPYHLEDMADDGAALLVALGIDSAHVVGLSMGGMIAQLIAINHPKRVRTLCSIMSNTGDRFTGQPTPRVLVELAKRREPKRANAVDTTMAFFRLVGGPDWDPEEQRRRSTMSVSRAYNPAGVLRQSLAIAARQSRTKALKQLSVPTLVIHGLSDPLVRASGGRATARAVPDSRLIMFPRMGHDLPATRHDEMVTAIITNTARSPT